MGTYSSSAYACCGNVGVERDNCLCGCEGVVFIRENLSEMESAAQWIHLQNHLSLQKPQHLCGEDNDAASTAITINTPSPKDSDHSNTQVCSIFFLSVYLAPTFSIYITLFQSISIALFLSSDQLDSTGLRRRIRLRDIQSEAEVDIQGRRSF